MKEESKIYTQDDYFNDEFPKKEPKQHVELINDNIEEFDKSIELFKQETIEEVAEKLYPIILEDDEWDKNKQYRDEWIDGAKWQQEKICNSEVLQRIRESKSDAEARRIIKTI